MKANCVIRAGTRLWRVKRDGFAGLPVIFERDTPATIKVGKYFSTVYVVSTGSVRGTFKEV